MILFLPIAGSLIYLYYNFYNQRNLDSIADGIEGVINSNHKIETTQKELKYTDTITNRTKMADEYMFTKNYTEAINLYKSCLTGYNKKDPETIKKLIKAKFIMEDYLSVIYYGDLLKSDIYFKNSESRIDYAWSYYKSNQPEIAENIFKSMERQFTNYPHRMEYGIFLCETNKKEKAKAVFDNLLEEIDDMDSQEQRLNKSIYKQIQIELNACS